MEHSASAPAVVMSDSDYYLPCNGVGATGHPNRLLNGAWSKDTGVHSSRINQIIKQAGKYPGPGKYIAHNDWTGGWGIHGGNKFGGSDRSYKSMHKYPDPRTYEVKDIGQGGISNASKTNLSTNPRILHGKVPKGKKRSFLTQAENAARNSPDPGHYTTSVVLANKLNPKIIKMTEWTKETNKTVSRKTKKEEQLAPCHYNPQWGQAEERIPNYTVPKEKASNFLDKAVKEKMLSVRDKLPLPGPGAYNIQNFDLSKTSRGSMTLQLRGLGRSPASGYM